MVLGNAACGFACPAISPAAELAGLLDPAAQPDGGGAVGIVVDTPEAPAPEPEAPASAVPDLPPPFQGADPGGIVRTWAFSAETGVCGPGIDSGLPHPAILMKVLTWARFLDLAGSWAAAAGTPWMFHTGLFVYYDRCVVQESIPDYHTLFLFAWRC